MDTTTVRIYKPSLEELKVYDPVPARAIDKILARIKELEADTYTVPKKFANEMCEIIANRLRD